MFTKTLFASAAIAAVAFAAPAMAQVSNTANGTGSITVIRPLTVTNTANLVFGTVTRPLSGSGTAVVSTAGALDVTGGVARLASSSTPTAAAFTVAGEGGQSVSVTVPPTFPMTSGANSLTVTTSNNLATPAATNLSNALGSAGTLSVLVGGSVPILSTTETGAYSGSFTVTAAYN